MIGIFEEKYSGYLFSRFGTREDEGGSGEEGEEVGSGRWVGSEPDGAEGIVGYGRL